MIEEQVPHLQISVYDVACVHILDGSTKLDSESSHLRESETSPLLYHVHDRSIRT